MTLRLSVARFLVHNALERNILSDLVIGYIAVVVIVVLRPTGCTYDAETHEISIGMEFSAVDFVNKHVGFSNVDQVTVVLRSTDEIRRIVCSSFVDHLLSPGMMGYDFMSHPLPTPNPGQDGVVPYLIKQVSKLHTNMLIKACFYEANIKAIHGHLKQKIGSGSQDSRRWSSEPDREQHLAMARILRSKHIACIEAVTERSSMVMLKSSLTTILCEDSLRAFKNMDKTFAENLPEGTNVTDGVAVHCRLPCLKATDRTNIWGLSDQTYVTRVFKVRTLKVDSNFHTEAQASGSSVWQRLPCDELTLF